MFRFSVLQNDRWVPELSILMNFLPFWIFDTLHPKGEKISHQGQPYLQVYICIPHSKTWQLILRNSPWWGRGWGRWVVGTIATPIQILIILIIFMAWSELNMSFFKKFLQFCILLSLWPQCNLGGNNGLFGWPQSTGEDTNMFTQAFAFHFRHFSYGS